MAKIPVKAGQTGVLANRGGHWPDTSASVNLAAQQQCPECSAALTAIEQASYTWHETDCFDRTRIIPNDIDLADRLDSALDLIEAALAARAADAAAVSARLDALRIAAAEAVAALDAVIGDTAAGDR